MTPFSTPIITTQDGTHTLFSEQFGVTFHSRFGAVTESIHVFINAGLRYKAVLGRQISILEAGFGTGLNAFLTALEAEKRGLSVQYTALERYPISLEQVQQLNYPVLAASGERKLEFELLHTAEWGKLQVHSPYFSFVKHMVDISVFRDEQQFDLIYFDAFAPQAQPGLWTPAIFENLFASLRSDGVLVTYCAQGAFKRTLKQAGFKVESPKGPPGKREMTRAWK